LQNTLSTQLDLKIKHKSSLG